MMMSSCPSLPQRKGKGSVVDYVTHLITTVSDSSPDTSNKEQLTENVIATTCENSNFIRNIDSVDTIETSPLMELKDETKVRKPQSITLMNSPVFENLGNLPVNMQVSKTKGSGKHSLLSSSAALNAVNLETENFLSDGEHENNLTGHTDSGNEQESIFSPTRNNLQTPTVVQNKEENEIELETMPEKAKDSIDGSLVDAIFLESEKIAPQNQKLETCENLENCHDGSTSSDSELIIVNNDENELPKTPNNNGEIQNSPTPTDPLTEIEGTEIDPKKLLKDTEICISNNQTPISSPLLDIGEQELVKTDPIWSTKDDLTFFKSITAPSSSHSSSMALDFSEQENFFSNFVPPRLSRSLPTKLETFNQLSEEIGASDQHISESLPQSNYSESKQLVVQGFWNPPKMKLFSSPQQQLLFRRKSSVEENERRFCFCGENKFRESDFYNSGIRTNIRIESAGTPRWKFNHHQSNSQRVETMSLYLDAVHVKVKQEFGRPLKTMEIRY